MAGIDGITRGARQRSGWLIPLAVFFATACLSALVLAYYFVPEGSALGVELPAPTGATGSVALSLGAARFRIRANYLPLASTRKGGAVAIIPIAALLPDLSGYSASAADAFADHSAGARVVAISLRATAIPPPEAERLRRIYLLQTLDRTGAPGPFGLYQYAFRADSGYHNQDLFVGRTNSGMVILLCTKADPEVAAPSCMRDTALAPDLAMSYRFKRAQLKAWRSIDAKVRALVTRFHAKP
jgi:hypothetical protein